MNDVLHLIGRTEELFAGDLHRREGELAERIGGASFLVLGGAGSVGQAVVKELFARRPARLHVVDLSENNLVELVRDLRSSLGYIEGDLQALPLDCGSPEFGAFLASQPPYQYVLNLAALKHVRSEKDPYTLMRMLAVNVLNTWRTLRAAASAGTGKYFAVSTDKAVAPANLMGASKRVMELCLLRWSDRVAVSTARFANVAFSDGSLLDGWRRRVEKRQPLSAPRDVWRYFMTAQEAGRLCLMSCLVGGSREAFAPRPSAKLPATDFPSIAERYLASLGYAVAPCATEDEARAGAREMIEQRRWPCYFFDSDTTGEKELEEFVAPHERADRDRFEDIDVVSLPVVEACAHLEGFVRELESLRAMGGWTKLDLVRLLTPLAPDLRHRETHKYLDGRM